MAARLGDGADSREYFGFDRDFEVYRDCGTVIGPRPRAIHETSDCWTAETWPDAREIARLLGADAGRVERTSA